MPESPPESPCVKICILDPQGYCIGCYRTIDEIARWRDLAIAEQRAVLRLVAERAAVRAVARK
jgi:predicted Fe-S protein YdhL (DUF1289 family)